MKRDITGDLVVISKVDEPVRAFVPKPLPPSPPVSLPPETQILMDQALLELGRLDGILSGLPVTNLLLYTFIRKEALLSSQIEGTQSSLSDLLLFEMDSAPGVPVEDVREVSTYVSAMEYGLERLRSGFPLCNRLLCEIHERLLVHGRGADKKPGEFRTSQNWIGGTRPGNARFVPPPPGHVTECMSSLEKFLNNEPDRSPAILKAGLAHVQFETIHPFLDGNGRLGRLLVTLILCNEKILREPLLYLSLAFKKRRQDYYDLLQNVRMNGDWEAWLHFFGEAMVDSCKNAISSASRLSKACGEDRDALRAFGRLEGSAIRVHEVMIQRPVISIPEICRKAGLAPNTTAKVLSAMTGKGMIRELTGNKRNRIFSYDHIISILNEDMEPLR